MTDNWWLWLVGILVVAVLAFYALRKNFNVEISSGDKKVAFTKPEKGPATEVNVLDGAKLEDVEAGDITGLKDKTGAREGSTSVNLLDKSEIKKAKLGDITGAEIGSGTKQDE